MSPGVLEVILGGGAVFQEGYIVTNIFLFEAFQAHKIYS